MYDGPNYFWLCAAEKSHGLDTTPARLGSLVVGAQSVYHRGWKRRLYLRIGFGRSLWIAPGLIGRDELIIKFSTRERNVLGLHSIRCRRDVIRFPT